LSASLAPRQQQANGDGSEATATTIHPTGVQMMRYVIFAMAILLSSVVSTQAQAQTQLSIGIGNRGVSLGFVMSTYPTLVRIPGYPVYYDPRVDSNYFFYDGLYWVYQDDDWYSSTWYNGPWDLVPPDYVPLFILRVPVRYYRRPPAYFRGWRGDSAPRWGEHWGRDWERQRNGWDRWDRRSVPRAAPLPTYQRNYSGSRYPHQLDQQRSIESRSYRYQPREAVSRQVLDQRRQGADSRGRQQQQQNDRQQQQQRNVRQQQDVQQQQQRNTRQQQDVQQQQRNVRQQQEVQQQQQRNVRQQQDVQQQQQRNVQQQQRRSQPAPEARGADNKGKGRPDRNKDQKDQKDNKDGNGHR
jgi:flagellar biosynthesis GTPase FlhF